LANTIELSQIRASHFDAVFYPGGHGPVWDLAENPDSISLIESMSATNKPVATVCHAAAVLRHTRAVDGSALVRRRKVTGFSNTEEEAVGLTKVVPYLIEDMLKSSGGIYTRADDWQPCMAIDGNLVTAQNPASSTGAAEAVIKLIGQSGHETIGRPTGA
jgi:putative intracellular protease/amidase